MIHKSRLGSRPGFTKALTGLMITLPCALVAVVTVGAAPASADGMIYAVVTLTNDTNSLIQIPFSGASTPDAWGTEGNTMQSSAASYEVMPDGTPPRVLAPGQTMLWGTKSNGGLLSTSGTGGQLSIPLPDENQTAYMNWSNPWSYWNGFGGGASGNQWTTNGTGFQGPNPYTITGGADSCGGDNTCLYSFALQGGPPAPAYTPGVLNSGQVMSMPTQCPSYVACKAAVTELTSSGGSTTFAFQGSGDPASQATWGGTLRLTYQGQTASLQTPYIAAAQMLANGDFVAYDADGDTVWQSNTAGNSAAFLTVTPGQVSVSTNSCDSSGTCWSNILWSLTTPNVPLANIPSPPGGPVPPVCSPLSVVCGTKPPGQILRDQPPGPPV